MPKGTKQKAADRPPRDLGEKLKERAELDGHRSPLLSLLQNVEERHGRKALQEAIGQWEEHAKDGPLGPAGFERPAPAGAKPENPRDLPLAERDKGGDEAEEGEE